MIQRVEGLPALSRTCLDCRQKLADCSGRVCRMLVFDLFDRLVLVVTVIVVGDRLVGVEEKLRDSYLMGDKEALLLETAF